MAKIDLPEMDKMPGNSNSGGEAKQAIKPVASGKRLEKTKKTGAKKFVSSLFSVDDRPRLDITEDIVVPALKNTFLDVISAITGAVTNAFEIALFGDMHGRTKSRSRDRDRFKNGYIDYTSKSDRLSRSSREHSRTSRELMDFSDIEFDTWEEANDVLTNMRDLLNRYESYVTVADFYALSNVSYTYQDRRWGWTDLSSAYPIRDGSVYVLVLPKPESIK